MHVKTSAPEHQDCDLLLQIATGSSFRLCFHPEKKAEDYSDYNSRSVIRDSFSEMQELITSDDFYAKLDDTREGYAELQFHGSIVDVITIIRVKYNPFAIEVMRNKKDSGSPYAVFKTSDEGLRFTSAGGMGDYHIVQTINKLPAAKYVGFGEQGGLNLIKNKQCITYFNYDNMKYSQVYGSGPLEEKELLYHSDPFSWK